MKLFNIAMNLLTHMAPRWFTMHPKLNRRPCTWSLDTYFGHSCLHSFSSRGHISTIVTTAWLDAMCCKITSSIAVAHQIFIFSSRIFQIPIFRSLFWWVWWWCVQIMNSGGGLLYGFGIRNVVIWYLARCIVNKNPIDGGSLHKMRFHHSFFAKMLRTNYYKTPDNLVRKTKVIWGVKNISLNPTLK